MRLNIRAGEKCREGSDSPGCPFAYILILHVLASKRRRVLFVFEERNGNATERREARMTGT